jgi:hypothetical protein
VPRISIRRFDNFKPVVFDQFLAAGDTPSPSARQNSTTRPCRDELERKSPTAGYDAEYSAIRPIVDPLADFGAPFRRIF